MMTSSYGWLTVLLGLSVTAAAVRGQASRLNRSVSVPSDASTPADAEKGSARRLQSLKWRYLIVMLTVRFADWLQGPYFYELYAKKTDSRTGAQLSAGAVSTLFLVGFCASMAFGTVAGSLTDTFGRKLGCLFCAFIYTVETLMTESAAYEVLFAGRILAGLASSMMHSVFESWLNSEAKRLRATDAWLSDVFGLQWFADGLVAVLAGVVAEALYGVAGPPAVFRASAACLGTSFFMIALLWRENIMKAAPAPSNTPAQPAVASRSVFANVSDALAFAWDDPRVILLALIQSLFEAAMYSFVLVWVPTLSAAAAAEAAATGSAAPSTLPFGLIFACFMVCIMIGSGLFAFAQASNRVVLGLLVVMLGSAASLGCVGLLSTQPTIVALGFLLFETFCGLYFPSVSSIRSLIIPNHIGSTLRSLFRVPLNVLVIVILVNLESLGAASVMLLCAAALLFASVLQVRLQAALIAHKSVSPRGHAS